LLASQSVAAGGKRADGSQEDDDGTDKYKVHFVTFAGLVLILFRLSAGT
jgi:hypothetical protein